MRKIELARELKFPLNFPSVYTSMVTNGSDDGSDVKYIFPRCQIAINQHVQYSAYYLQFAIYAVALLYPPLSHQPLLMG